MRTLCCVDGTNLEQVSGAIGTLLKAEARTIAVLYVTDTEPEIQMEQQRERHLRPLHSPRPRREQIQQVEGAMAQEILDEASHALGGAEMLRRTGRPERAIVQAALEWQADLIVICSRSPNGGGPRLGPKSPGHTARFVVDHAPCPVLLVRPRSNTVEPDPLR